MLPECFLPSGVLRERHLGEPGSVCECGEKVAAQRPEPVIQSTAPAYGPRERVVEGHPHRTGRGLSSRLSPRRAEVMSDFLGLGR